LLLSLRCRYHLGSLCFGALVIVIAQIVQAVFSYIERKMNGLQVLYYDKE